MSDTVSVERTIAAPPEAIFTLISDPARHRTFDGSGTVREAKDTTGPLEKGSVFGMSMKMGIGYSMKNTVIEFEKDRLIAWQTTGAGVIGKLMGGRIWRYELEPLDGATLVRETWDISQERNKFLVKPMAGKTKKNMAATLERIEELVTAT